jgi:hypothetical protein
LGSEFRQSAAIGVSGVNILASIVELINVLDRHLANGLGTATAIDEVRFALAKAERHHQQGKQNSHHGI